MTSVAPSAALRKGGVFGRIRSCGQGEASFKTRRLLSLAPVELWVGGA